MIDQQNFNASECVQKRGKEYIQLMQDFIKACMMVLL